VRTVVELGNTNCPWCLNAMVDRLRSRSGVLDVKVNASSGCLEVIHDHDDVAALLVDIGDVLRGSIEVGNGDVVMVGLDAQVASDCRWVGHGAESRDSSRPFCGAVCPTRKRCRYAPGSEIRQPSHHLTCRWGVQAAVTVRYAVHGEDVVSFPTDLNSQGCSVRRPGYLEWRPWRRPRGRSGGAEPSRIRNSKS
jgi:hypothetical protein